MLFGSLVVIIASSANGFEEIRQAADLRCEEEVLKARAFSILHEDFEGRDGAIFNVARYIE